MTEITLNGVRVAPCRRCGATGRESDKPTKRCVQCQGQKFVSVLKRNESGPGIDRLVKEARARAPKNAPKGPAMMILWEKVRGQKRLRLVDQLKETQGQRNRLERKRYKALCREAIKQGILVRVPEKGDAESLQVEA